MAVSEFENTVLQMIIQKAENWYDGYKDVYIDYSQQVGYHYKNGGHGVVDIVVHIYCPRKRYGGSYYNFEIKSCASDLNSGRGLNLFGMYNYLVYPKSQITTLPGIITFDMIEKKLKEIGCEHAGIIAVISDDDFIVERKARRYYGDEVPKSIKGHKFKNCRF